MNRMHDSPETDMRPDDRGVLMALEQRLHQLQVHRLRVGLRKRHVDVVVSAQHFRLIQ